MRVMSQSMTRRAALKQISAAGAGVLVSRGIIRGQGSDITDRRSARRNRRGLAQPVDCAHQRAANRRQARQPSCQHDGGLVAARRQRSASRRHARRRTFKSVRAGDLRALHRYAADAARRTAAAKPCSS